MRLNIYKSVAHNTMYLFLHTIIMKLSYGKTTTKGSTFFNIIVQNLIKKVLFLFTGVTHFSLKLLPQLDPLAYTVKT